MLINLKALVVVLALAWAVFRTTRPLCLQFMTVEVFTRRRNVWFSLTIVAFVSPSFWPYALFALILLTWAGARDENPLALYVLVTFTVPNVGFYISGGVVNQLFELSQYRLLSFSIIIPSMIRKIKSLPSTSDSSLAWSDLYLISFLLLQVALQLPYESATAVARRGFLLFLDTFVVFYAFARITNRHNISEVLLNFWLSCAIMASIGIAEWSKTWLLYGGLLDVWGASYAVGWLTRGDSLRAQAASGHSLNFGYLMAVGLGFFLYLRCRLPRSWFNWGVIAVLCLGLVASGSRGAWITAIIVTVLFVMLRPGATKNIARASAVSLLLLAALYFTPFKESVLDRMPLIGNSDQDTIEYRQQLWDVAVPLLKQNPIFGDPFVARNMEVMRNGVGVIDIINGYLFTSLFYGLAGLGLQLAALLVGFWKAVVTLRRVRFLDEDLSLLGSALIAVFVGSLFFIATAGFGPTTYILSALMLSYSRCSNELPATDGKASTLALLSFKTSKPI